MLPSVLKADAPWLSTTLISRGFWFMQILPLFIGIFLVVPIRRKLKRQFQCQTRRSMIHLAGQRASILSGQDAIIPSWPTYISWKNVKHYICTLVWSLHRSTSLIVHLWSDTSPVSLCMLCYFETHPITNLNLVLKCSQPVLSPHSYCDRFWPLSLFSNENTVGVVFISDVF